MIVDLNDHVALLGERSADPIGQEGGQVARRPAAQAAVNRVAGAAEAGIARPRFGQVALAGLTRDIDVGQHMMNDPAIARPVLHGRDVLVLFELGGDDEAAIDVLTLGRHREIGADVDHQVGSAELPVVGKSRVGRQVGPVAFRRIRRGPRD